MTLCIFLCGRVYTLIIVIIKMIYSFLKGMVIIMIEFLWNEKKKIPPKRKDFLKKAISDCQQAINDAWTGLQNTNEPDLIDRYIYEMNAANVRYRFLLNEIRELAAAEESTPQDPSADTEKLPPRNSHPAPVCLQAPVLSSVLPDAVATVPNISPTNLDTETSLLNRSFR